MTRCWRCEDCHRGKLSIRRVMVGNRAPAYIPQLTERVMPAEAK